MGGTEASPPAEAEACHGTWFLFDFVRGAGKKQRQCVGITSRLPFHGDVRFGWCDNDPSAGSPTETLLRLHLPLNGEVKKSSHQLAHNEASESTVPIFHRVIQSVGATGGVYKGQGRNQRELMTRIY